jgi:lipopolysaccharide export system permease protein
MSGLFKGINFYMKYNATFYLIILHLILSFPELLMHGLPIATLLALSFYMSDLSKKNEITAIKAAGINMWRIIVLFLIIGFTIGACDFAVREFIIPKTSLYSEIIKKEKIQKEQISIQTDFYNQIIILPNNERVIIGHLDILANTIKDVIIEKYNNDFKIKYLILAKEGRWENNSWVLKNGIIRDFSSNFWNETCFKDYNSNINITSENMVIRKTRYDIMNIRIFKKHIIQLGFSGQTATKAKVMYNMRFAAVFSHIIVMMIGITFAINFEKKLNRILGSALSLSVAFTYWWLQAITKFLGENIILSPFIAAWIPNFIFATIGIYFLIKAKK